MDVDSSCTSTSMYLSFDAESTISSAMFKTLETSIENEEDHHNTTLEANGAAMDFQIERLRSSVEIGTSPLHPFAPRNKALQQYNALSSTPSKNYQLTENADTITSTQSGINQCIRLDMPNLDDIEEEQQQHDTELVSTVEDTKDNVQPESGEGSTLSMSSSVEVVATTVIEKKLTTLALSDDENTPPTPPQQMENVKLMQDTRCVSKTTASSSAAPNNGYNKQRRSILAPKNIRKSICEPDLKANKPSRIISENKKRTSLAAMTKIPTSVLASNVDESKIPTIVDRMLKIVDPAANTQTQISHTVISKSIDATNNVLSVATCRATKQPNKAPCLGEKRPYSVSQRMSIFVKTTLNSPARKMARRSVMVNPQPTRRSVFPKSSESSAETNADGKMRKSMLPIGRPTRVLSKESQNSTTTKRQSINPQMAKDVANKSEKSAPPALKLNKLDTLYVCVVCGSKFSLKSLFDAHKRSHEDGTPLVVRKPITAHTVATTTLKTATATNDEKTCKFCDKKFALVRALHIHLLQNCAKIPPNEKRKLQFTELNHVEKAQLPDVFHGGQLYDSATTKTAPFHMQSHKITQSNMNSAPTSSIESLIDKEKDITVLANELVAAVDGVMTKMQPPKGSSMKKKTTNKKAHTGVYRTPNKTVPCHLCKKKFKNVLEYTNHSMTMHSMESANDNRNMQEP